MKYTCPFGHRCETRDEHGNVDERCRLFVQLRGTDPQTGELVDEWSCAIAFMPVLQVETSQQTRQAGAAIESLRNEVVRAGPPDVVQIGNQSSAPALIKPED